MYRDPLAYTRTASKEARPFSSAAASHLRLLAEEMLAYTPDADDPVKGGTSGWAHCAVCTFANDPAAVYRAQGKTVYTDSPKADPFSAFYSIAWTVGIRDALIASATGRALDLWVWCISCGQPIRLTESHDCFASARATTSSSSSEGTRRHHYRSQVRKPWPTAGQTSEYLATAALHKAARSDSVLCCFLR